MNYAFEVNDKEVQWSMIFMVIIVMFTVVKGNLQWNGNYVVYGDFVSCTETKITLASKIRDWHILIENKRDGKINLVAYRFVRKKRKE